jgi:tight adherence protein B
MKLIFAGMASAFFCFYCALYYLGKNWRVKSSSKRMGKWFERKEKTSRKSVVFLIGDRFDQSELSEGLRAKLEQADVRLKASEYAAICLVATALLWAVNHLVLQLLFPLDITVAHTVVWLVSKYLLFTRKNRRAENFNKQLPEVCRLIGNTMKAGLSIHQGIEMVGRELKAPAGPEFSRISHQLRLGRSFEEVMQQFRDSVESREIHLFVNTVLIQRRVGGNLAEVLSLMANTLEERGRVNQEVKTATSEQKFSAILLPIMPLLMAIMMNLVIPGFLNPLFTPAGLVILAVFAGLNTLAFLIIRQISRIRV